SARPHRVVCLMASFAPGRSGRSLIQQIIASMSWPFEGRLWTRQIMSPLETSMSSARVIVTDIGGTASSTGPSWLSIDATVLVKPDGSTTTSSTADLALILIDARKGVLEQSRRHAFIASLLRIPHLVLCVNKMDLVDYDQDVFESIKEDFRSFAMKLDVPDLTFVPLSALHGDNIVHRSSVMEWYEGSSLLHHLEEVHIASDRNLIDVRFPVQYVIRPMSNSHHDYRGYAGQVLGGVIKPGDEVVVLPSGFTSTVASIDTHDGPVQ